LHSVALFTVHHHVAISTDIAGLFCEMTSDNAFDYKLMVSSSH